MALRTGAPAVGARLVWYDRSGRIVSTVGDQADFSNPALSPDARKVAICIADERGKRDVWIYDLVRGNRSRLTSHPDDDLNPFWSADGVWVYFTSDRRGGGYRDIYRKRADGDAAEEVLYEGSGRSYVESASPDGRFVVFNQQPLQGGAADIMALPLSGERQPVRVVATGFEEGHSAVSPNGRWIAYRSVESGQSEVYVKSFPSGQGKWHVSAAGGWEPRWRADGKELFYATYDKIYAVPVKTDGPSFESGVAQPLFDAQLSNVRRNRFVSSPDGSRFLAVVLTDEAANAPFTVLLHWASRPSN